MTGQTGARIFAVLLVATGLLFLPHPLRGQDKSVPSDDNKLVAELNEELGDVEAEDELVDEETVEEQIEADLKKSTLIDYGALEAAMERDGTTIEKVILVAVKQAEDDAGEGLAAFAWAADKKVNAKSVKRHFVADVRGRVDHERDQSGFRLSGMIPDSEPLHP
jgi:hypothetical protein